MVEFFNTFFVFISSLLPYSPRATRGSYVRSSFLT